MATNQSNVNRGNSQRLTNTALQDLDSYDFITSFPDGFQPPTVISNDNPNLERQQLSTIISNENPNIDRLKTKIDCFCQDHPNIITEIKNYFYDEMIVYTVKRSFKLPFTTADMIKTEQLLHRFFIEHEANTRIIFIYFFDDIKPFLLNNSFFNLTSGYGTINTLLSRGICEAGIFFLKNKGAQLLTSLLYQTNVEPNQSGNLSEQLTLQTQSIFNQMNFAAILAYISLLCMVFGWEIFFILLYFFIGLIIIVFFVYLLMKTHTT